MRPLLFWLLFLLNSQLMAAEAARQIEPAYQPAKVVYDFYLDKPDKMSTPFIGCEHSINH